MESCQYSLELSAILIEEHYTYLSKVLTSKVLTNRCIMQSKFVMGLGIQGHIMTLNKFFKATVCTVSEKRPSTQRLKPNS